MWNRAEAFTQKAKYEIQKIKKPIIAEEAYCLIFNRTFQLFFCIASELLNFLFNPLPINFNPSVC
jgi:hypothetical protein